MLRKKIEYYVVEVINMNQYICGYFDTYEEAKAFVNMKQKEEQEDPDNRYISNFRIFHYDTINGGITKTETFYFDDGATEPKHIIWRS